MCLAMQMRMQKERAEGRSEGKAEGAINMGRSLGTSDDRLVEMVMRDCGVDRAYVEYQMRKMDAGRA